MKNVDALGIGHSRPKALVPRKKAYLLKYCRDAESYVEVGGNPEPNVVGSGLEDDGEGFGDF